MRPLWGRAISIIYFLPTYDPSGVDNWWWNTFYQHTTPLRSYVGGGKQFAKDMRARLGRLIDFYLLATNVQPLWGRAPMQDDLKITEVINAFWNCRSGNANKQVVALVCVCMVANCYTWISIPLGNIIECKTFCGQLEITSAIDNIKKVHDILYNTDPGEVAYL